MEARSILAAEDLGGPWITQNYDSSISRGRLPARNSLLAGRSRKAEFGGIPAEERGWCRDPWIWNDTCFFDIGENNVI